MKRSLLAFICLFVTASYFAAPPAPWVSVSSFPQDRVKKIPTMNEMKAMGYSPEKISKVLGLKTGRVKLAVVFIDFSDVKFYENAGGTGGTIQRYVSNTAISAGTKIVTETGLLKDMINYFNETSTGKLTVDIYPFTGPSGQGYHLSGTPISTYGKDVYVAGKLIEEAGVVTGTLFKHAVAAVGSDGGGINNTDYHALMVVHAGVGQESQGTSSLYDNNIWSLFVDWSELGAGYDAGGFFEAETVPALEWDKITETYKVSPFGVLCHEFGHQLGLPDLYKTSSPTASRVGSWDLMDNGTWVGDPEGSQPPHMSAWNKALLGWITPVEQTSAGTITLNSSISSAFNCIKVPVLASTTEYFLFEYRQKTGDFESGLRGEGVLVWHIDESQATSGRLLSNTINNGSPLAVALVEKDNDNDVGSNLGEASDPFKTASDIFATPQSDGYMDGPTYLTLFDFSGVGTAAMTARLFSIPATTNLVNNKAINYPNPVKNALSTTIRVNFSRPFTTAALRIYSVAGEFIFEKALTATELNATASLVANEWVYEYSWDLKNSGGVAVASGIYLYNIVAEVNTQKVAKVGKLAIIR